MFVPDHIVAAVKEGHKVWRYTPNEGATLYENLSGLLVAIPIESPGVTYTSNRPSEEDMEH